MRNELHVEYNLEIKSFKFVEANKSHLTHCILYIIWRVIL